MQVSRAFGDAGLFLPSPVELVALAVMRPVPIHETGAELLASSRPVSAVLGRGNGKKGGEN